MNGCNIIKDWGEELGILCYKVPAPPVKWYSVVWKWTWISSTCIFQIPGQQVQKFSTSISRDREHKSQNKRTQVTEWENIFAKGISDKGLLSKIYKELLKFKNKKSRNLFKMGKTPD